jgi:quinol monooxygenase YgiN
MSLRTVGTMTCSPEDLPEVEGIFQTFIDHVRANEPGVLTYHYFVDDDPLVIHVIEEYADAEVMVQHFANLPGEAIGRLLPLVQIGPMHFYGEATDELRATLAPFGDVQYHRPLRSIDAGAPA